MVRVFSNEDVAKLLDIGECVGVLAEAYEDLASEQAISSQRVDTLIPAEPPAEYHAMKSMGGAFPRYSIQAMRLDSDLLRWPEREGTTRREKVTSTQDDSLRIGKENGLVLLYSAESGEPLAILPDGEIQRRRVAATNALAARHLTHEDTDVLALLGSGWQADMAIRAMDTTLSLSEVRVYSPTLEHRQEFAERLDNQLEATIHAVNSADTAVTGANVIQTVTNSLEPTIREEWITPGVHVSTVRASELSPDSYSTFDVLAIHSKDHQGPQHNIIPGDRIPDELTGGYPSLPDEAIELADLIAEPDHVNIAPTTTTGFANNVGLGLQFAACGHLLLENASETDVGNEIPTEWFIQDVPQR